MDTDVRVETGEGTEQEAWMVARKKEEERIALAVERHLTQVGFTEYVTYLRSPWRIMWTNLIAGIFRGLGLVLGATVVLALSVWLLVDLLGNLPWVGAFFQEAGSFVQNIQTVSEKLSGF